MASSYSPTRRAAQQEVYKIYTAPGSTLRAADQPSASSHNSVKSSRKHHKNTFPYTASPRINKLVDRQIYESMSPATLKRHSPSSAAPAENAHRYKRFRSLSPLWNELGIPVSERIYSSKVLSAHPEYLAPYETKLRTLIDLRTSFAGLSRDRRDAVAAIKRVLAARKGSKRLLVYSLTRIKHLTILLSTLVNLARIICRKPVSLQPFAVSLDSKELNWLLYLREERLYSIANVALLFTIFNYVDGQGYQYYIRLVKDYFCSILGNTADDCFNVQNDNKEKGEVETAPAEASRVTDEQLASMEGEISLNFLLGLQAESMIENDSLAYDWDTFLYSQPGMFYPTETLPYTNLAPIQILEAVKNEERAVGEFRDVLSSIKLTGCNTPLVPVTPNNPYLEIYPDTLTDAEDDNILLAEVMMRQAHMQPPRIVLSSLNTVEVPPSNNAPPSSARKLEDAAIDNCRSIKPMDDEQTFVGQSNLTTPMTTMIENSTSTRAETLTLDSSSGA